MRITCFVAALLAMPALAEPPRAVFLEEASGARHHIADLNPADDGGYTLSLVAEAFSEHFLSMRPFKCLDGPEKTWCHVPYPYENARNISGDLTDLEYDLLFVWKGRTDYGIDMWNGVYYRLQRAGGQITGIMHEMDMDRLAVPPAKGDLRPISQTDLTEADPDSHWLPRLVIE